MLRTGEGETGIPATVPGHRMGRTLSSFVFSYMRLKVVFLS